MIIVLSVVPGPAAPIFLVRNAMLMPYPGPSIRNSSIRGLISLPSGGDVH